MDKYKDIKQLAHVPLASLLKFDICDLIPQYDKLLYLDGDIIVRQDLSELYQTDLNDNYVAGVAHSLGIVTGEKKVYLAPKYNVMLDKVDYEKKYYSMKDYNSFFHTAYKSRREIVDTAVIIHFTGSIKPWSYGFAKCGKEWNKYYKIAFGNSSRLQLKGRTEFCIEQIRKNGWKSIYWLMKDKTLSCLGEWFDFYPDKSHGEWN